MFRPQVNVVLSAVLLLGLAEAVCRAEDEVRFRKDVVYGRADNQDLLMDVAQPGTGGGPYPVVVCIHGGGWRAGSKSDYSNMIRQLAKRGYVAVSVAYRLAPKYKFPCQLEDVKCAVRYLRSQAKDLELDPARIGALGHSAGGHLSLLLGLMNPEDGLEGQGGYPGLSSKVQAVVNFFGPADFLAPTPLSPAGKFLVGDFLGTTDKSAPVVKQASPVEYIDPKDPPVITFHGDADNLVPVEQAQRLDAALKKAGVKHQLEILAGKGHGWKEPEQSRTDKQFVEFFDAHLKKK